MVITIGRVKFRMFLILVGVSAIPRPDSKTEKALAIHDVIVSCTLVAIVTFSSAMKLQF